MFSESLAINVATKERSLAVEPPSSEDLAWLFNRQPVEKLEAGAALFWEGDQASHVFEVVEGVLRVYKILNDGRRVITGFLYPGDLVGLSLRDRYLYTAEAVTRTKVRRFARSRFDEEINRSPTLRPQLFARLCDEMAAAQDQMVLLARKSAEERVASFLLLIARRLSGNPQLPQIIEIPMTRLDMADYLGITIETVSRIMTRLTGRGVIAAKGRHTLVIRKPEKLEVLAGEADDRDRETGGGAAFTRQAVWPN